MTTFSVIQYLLQGTAISAPSQISPDSWEMKETTYSMCSRHTATGRMGDLSYPLLFTCFWGRGGGLGAMDTCGFWAQVCSQGIGGVEAVDLLLLDLRKQPAG